MGGPFESGALTHYGFQWEPSKVFNALRLLLGALSKAEYLHITFAVPFKSRIGYSTHYSCCWGPYKSRVLNALQLLLGAPSKTEYLRITVAVEGSSKTEYLHITVAVRPFKNRELMHYSGCLGPL